METILYHIMNKFCTLSGTLLGIFLFCVSLLIEKEPGLNQRPTRTLLCDHWCDKSLYFFWDKDKREGVGETFGGHLRTAWWAQVTELSQPASGRSANLGNKSTTMKGELTGGQRCPLLQILPLCGLPEITRE